MVQNETPSAPYAAHTRKTHILKKWWFWAAFIVIVGGVGAWWYNAKVRPTKKNSQRSALAAKSASTPKQLPAAESGLLPWQLQAPLSRMAVYPGQSKEQLVLAGGLTTNNTSSNGIYTLNTSNGSLANTGTLPAPAHDAASAMIGSSYGIFGGGDSSSVNTAHTFSLSGSISSSGTLPHRRSDAVAVAVGNTTYIIGGYDGAQADAQVLTTTDGAHFKTLGPLPVPVRYPAAAALGNDIYVFGGEAVSGAQSGKPVDTVQVINTATHTIRKESWKLPVPLEGAAAFTINNELFLAGGQSTQPESITPGVGVTQVPGVKVPDSSKTYNMIWALDVAQHKLLPAGHLQLPVSNTGVAVIGSHAWLVGGESNGQVVSAVQMVTPNTKFGFAGQAGAGSPYYGGDLMVADRGNNRLLVMDPAMQIIWRYPSSATNTQAASGFYFPDDAFFANKGTEIISNQENNNTVVILGYPSGKILWTYGHPLHPGSAYGYLRAPDDAYLLKNNDIVVADDQNCRVLFINQAKKVISQIGKTGVCQHNPGVSLGAPNGDTPLYDGNVLISEIFGSWVSEYTPQGKMVWTTHLPIAYPSDPQQLGAGPGKNPDDYLIADYSNPGSIVRFTREGKILYKYHVISGPGMLNHPSLVELLPSGVYMANDDHRDRMVAIDPATGALVWQYGTNDTPGTARGMLHKPDGFDLLLSNGTTPTHSSTK